MTKIAEEMCNEERESLELWKQLKIFENEKQELRDKLKEMDIKLQVAEEAFKKHQISKVNELRNNRSCLVSSH